MTDVALLKEKIESSGLKKNFIAKQLNLTPQGFYLKANGKYDFTSSEIQCLCKLLRISAQREVKAIFFSQ